MLHRAGDENCGQSGIILLQLVPDEENIPHLIDLLAKIDGVEVKEMQF
ncbi:MAG: hypothetical protein R6U46_10615 [Marinilabilia sp.]